MPGMDGMEVLEKLRKERPDIRVVIITAHGTIDSAVEAMKLGAVDFIEKPFTQKKSGIWSRKLLNEKPWVKKRGRIMNPALNLRKNVLPTAISGQRRNM